VHYGSIAMTKVSAKQARDSFSDTLDRVRVNRERIVVQRNGKDIAALIPMDDLELLQELEDAVDARAAREALADPTRIPWEKLKASLGL